MTSSYVPRVQRNEYEAVNMIPFYHLGRQYLDIRTHFPTARSVLIIGVGDGFLVDILTRAGYKVETIDIDASLHPTHILSIHELATFKKQYDLVVCANVLEHLPAHELDRSLAGMQAVAKKGVIIVVPHAGVGLGIGILLSPLVRRWLALKLPLFAWKRHRFDGQHYWELGTRGYSCRWFIRAVSQHFTVVSSGHNPDWDYAFHVIAKRRGRKE